MQPAFDTWLGPAYGPESHHLIVLFPGQRSHACVAFLFMSGSWLS